MSDNIYTLIIKATSGNLEDVFKLIKQYERLIKKYSYIYGIYDEELNDYLKDKIFANISKFKIKK